MADNNLCPEDEQEIIDFLVVFLATIIHTAEGVTLPPPANDNNPETGGFDDAA